MKPPSNVVLNRSDPASKTYGNHYSKAEVAELFAPSQESVDTVTNWLIKSGIPADEIKAGTSKGWLDFTTTVSKLESLLQTDYSFYLHPRSDTEHLGTESYMLPAGVSPHVDFITPAVAMGQVKKSAQRKRDDAKTAPFPRVIPFEPYPNQNTAAAAAASNGTTLPLLAAYVRRD